MKKTSGSASSPTRRQLMVAGSVAALAAPLRAAPAPAIVIRGGWVLLETDR